MTTEVKAYLANVLLEITPKSIYRIDIRRDYGGNATWSWSRWGWETGDAQISSPSPLRNASSLLIFMHECAHVALKHIYCGRPGYFNEIAAWALVYRWLEKYNITIQRKKAFVLDCLKHAWEHPKTKRSEIYPLHGDCSGVYVDPQWAKKRRK